VLLNADTLIGGPDDDTIYGQLVTGTVSASGSARVESGNSTIYGRAVRPPAQPDSRWYPGPPYQLLVTAGSFHLEFYVTVGTAWQGSLPGALNRTFAISLPAFACPGRDCTVVTVLFRPDRRHEHDHKQKPAEATNKDDNDHSGHWTPPEKVNASHSHSTPNQYGRWMSCSHGF
jgi:hypothetical protein